VREEQHEDVQQYNLVQEFGSSPLWILACDAKYSDLNYQPYEGTRCLHL